MLKLGVPLQVTLLAEVPESNDPVTWHRVPTAAFAEFSGIPSVLEDVDNVLAVLRVLVDCHVTTPTMCPCVGVTYQGQCVRVATVRPQYLSEDVRMNLEIQFQVQPWEG